MRLLIVNDDGIYEKGIQKLARELEKDYELTIVAPENQRSAQSHAITLEKSLIVKEVELEGIKSKAYSVSGTPVDCVRVALDKLVKEPVDLVISGVNAGLNVGLDILYSGTVSAAIEAHMYKIPSIALSAKWDNGKINYDLAVNFVKDLLEKSKEQIIKNNIILSINTPLLEEDQIKGVKVCKIGGIVYDYYYMEDGKVKGESTLRIDGRRQHGPEEDTDRYYISKGYITITPLHYDLTNYDLLEEVESWL
ncbi:MAG: 5'/3'-nucleotidase SurE [Tissierellia bacterium]|nr:5'/3'-nucleotidase SurE [Tissierellia bacterium]